jgi:hypothetical protein
MKPAVTAAWWPKLRVRLTTFSRGSTRQALQNAEGTVRAPVVDDEELMIFSPLLGRSCDATVQFLNAVLFVQGWNHDGDHQST